MLTARHLFRASLLLSTILLHGSASAQDPKPSLIDDPTVDVVQMGFASRVAPDQVARLEEVLERYRGVQSRGGWGRISPEMVMGPGFSYDCRHIAAVEKRLIAEGYLRKSSVRPPAPPPPVEPPSRWTKAPPPAPKPPPPRCLYDDALTEAMRNFQADRKVLGFGQLGGKTVTQLNRPVEEIVEILEQDLGRWRSRNLRFPATYLLVNIPFFEVNVFENNREEMRIRAIVGQTVTQTPQFSDEIEYIIVNPDWGIPESIAKNEMRPAARRDPNYYRWQGITDTGGSLRQKPGPRNPLGRIKFVFPNENDVYMHDTPEKRAFTAAVRSLSHGCVRLSRPMDMANYLLGDEPSWDRRRLQKAVESGKTTQINLKRHMPVYIVYSTTRVNEDGRLEIRPDIYRKNRRATPQEAEVPRAGNESFYTGP